MPANETAGVTFPPPLLYALGVLAGAGLDRVLPLPLPWTMPDLVLRLLAAAPFVLAGLALDLWALAIMQRARTTVLPWGRASALVTRGPFRFSRNPIYLGYALEHVGVAIAIGSPWALVLLAPVVLAMDRLVIPREERHLATVFGADYLAFKRRVRRWI